MDAPQGGSEESERVAPAGGEVEPVESDTVDGGTEDEVIGVEAAEEFFDQVADVQDETGYHRTKLRVSVHRKSGGNGQTYVSVPYPNRGIAEIDFFEIYSSFRYVS